MRLQLLAVLLLSGLPACGAQPRLPSSRPRPDVFLITIDTLRADHLGCYGDTQVSTPALDRLAAQGVRFASAFTASTITNTAHASILTGLYPSRTGMLAFGSPLGPGVLTLAQAFHQNGYATAAFIGSVILDSRVIAPGLDRGFDFYDNFPRHLPAASSRYGRLERRAAEVLHHAESWLSAHPRSRRPRFVWIHLYDPHDPYDPPPPFRERYRGHLYDGEIAYTDSALGAFLDYLKARKDDVGSALLVTADHGEGLGEHGEDTHGIFLYDSTTHVPLIVKLPSGAAAGAVVAQQVRTVDIAPTLLEIAGISTPASFDGAPLQPLWQEPQSAQPDRVAVSETDYPLRFGWAPLQSVRAAQQKYIEAPRPEFYDLPRDPGETRNLYRPWDAGVQRLRALLTAYRRQLEGPAAPAGTVTAQQERELKALGYWGNDRGATTVAPPSLLPDPKDKIQVQNALHQALLAEEEGRTAVARTGYLRALKLDPQSAMIRTLLGRLLLAQHQPRQALAELQAAQKLQPSSAELRQLILQARSRLGAGNDQAGSGEAAK